MKDIIINLGHKITYNDDDIIQKFNIQNDEEENQFRNVIYNYDLLMILKMEDFLEHIINEKIKDLHDDIMVKSKEINNIVTNICEAYSLKDTTLAFMMLFSYDNLHLFYPCICDFFDTGNISINKLNLLKNNIF